jgi:hypothetical protein
MVKPAISTAQLDREPLTSLSAVDGQVLTRGVVQGENRLAGLDLFDDDGTRRRRTKPSSDVQRAGSPDGPMLRSGGRGRPASFGYEPFMCAWDRPHTTGGHAGRPASARTPRRRA